MWWKQNNFLAAIIKIKPSVSRETSPQISTVSTIQWLFVVGDDICGNTIKLKKRRHPSLSSMILLWESLLVFSVYHNPSPRRTFKELWITIPSQLLSLFNKFLDIKKQKNFQRTCLPSLSNSRAQSCQRLLWNSCQDPLWNGLKWSAHQMLS